MSDCLVLSDTHLASDVCQSQNLSRFLDGILAGGIATEKLILNGDILDNIDFRRLRKSHWIVLKKLRKISKKIDVVWVKGNHEPELDCLSAILGVSVVDELVIESGGERILILHGDRFDRFIENFPATTWIADTIYRLLQQIDRSHRFARFAKQNSKVFLRVVEKVKAGALARAAKLDCSKVICGHVHMAEQDDAAGYYNSGCWTERTCTYLTVQNGSVKLREYQPTLEGAAHE